MSTHADRMQEEQSRAIRALLRWPCLISGRHDESLALIRRHADALREWFQTQAGWRLHVEPGLARLFKQPGDLDSTTRSARDTRSGAPFSKRRYVLLCLAFAALERSERQTTLRAIADEILSSVANDPELEIAGFTFTLETISDRRDLVAVVRWLIDIGVLDRRDGSEDAYLRDREDVLYDVQRSLLSRLPQWTARGPSLVECDDLGEFIGELFASGPLLSEQAIRDERRHRLARRLLDDPVVYFEDLDADDIDYLHRTQRAVLRTLAERTQLEVELRAEGVALVDTSGMLTDARLPEQGTSGHVTLGVADFLARRSRAGELSITLERIERAILPLREQCGRYWSKDAREPGSESRLAREAIDRLVELDLVRYDADGCVRPMPAIARHTLAPLRIAAAPSELADQVPNLPGILDA